MIQRRYPGAPVLPWLWSVTDLTALTGGPLAPGDNGVHAYSVADAPLGVGGFNIYVTYVALGKGATQGTGEIHQLQFPQARAAWTDVNLTQQGGGLLALAGHRPVAYLFVSKGTFHVFYISSVATSQGIDCRVNELWQDINGWHYTDLTGLISAPPPSLASPSAYTAEFQQTQHVLYIGEDGHVNELWWSVDQWYHNDLTIAAGAPLAAVGTSVAGFVSEADQTQNVHFIGQDGQLHGVRWQADLWQRHDAFIAGGIPAAAQASPVGYFSPDGVERVVYIGVDGHLRELSFDGLLWQLEDASQDTNVLVDTAATLAAYPGLDAGTRRIVVLPSGGGLVQQFSNDGGAWSYAVLLDSSGANAGESPDAGATPGAFAAPAVGQEFVFFPSVNFNITALAAPYTPVIE
jgi:hypothetical protein